MPPYSGAGASDFRNKKLVSLAQGRCNLILGHRFHGRTFFLLRNLSLKRFE
jgi:hypothetical protein